MFRQLSRKLHRVKKYQTNKEEQDKAEIFKMKRPPI